MDPTPAGMLALLLILAGWSALVSVDERALGPLVFHEPLVASGVAGLLAGVPGVGILIGLTLQLIWPGLRPLGGSRLPTPGLAALVGLAWYLFLPDESGPWHLPIALGAAMGAAAWGRAAEDVLRRRNAQRERRTDVHGKRLWRGEWLAAAGAAEAIARGPLAIGLLVGLPLVALRWVASEPRGLAAFSSFFMPLDSRGWSELIPPDPALAGVWFFAAGGLLRLVFRAARGARGGGRGGDDPRAEPGGAPAMIGAPPGGGHAARSSRGGRIGPALWVRLLLLQAGFSGAYLQRSGFVALAELLCRGRAGGSSGPESGIEADLAQARALNTHPAMAAALAGALGRGLHGCDAGVAGRPLSRLLEVGGASLAQYGDRLFWGGTRPLLALTATAIAPVAPRAGVGVFLAAGLILELGSRVALHGWGARVGWAVATGLQG
ncbi:MAG: PTS sugar transporter subunit IIC, partial [Candidatus Eisenbacteria bacterium]